MKSNGPVTLCNPSRDLERLEDKTYSSNLIASTSKPVTDREHAKRFAFNCAIACADVYAGSAAAPSKAQNYLGAGMSRSEGYARTMPTYGVEYSDGVETSKSGPAAFAPQPEVGGSSISYSDTQGLHADAGYGSHVARSDGVPQSPIGPSNDLYENQRQSVRTLPGVTANATARSDIIDMLGGLGPAACLFHSQRVPVTDRGEHPRFAPKVGPEVDARRQSHLDSLGSKRPWKDAIILMYLMQKKSLGYVAAVPEPISVEQYNTKAKRKWQKAIEDWRYRIHQWVSLQYKHYPQLQKEVLETLKMGRAEKEDNVCLKPSMLPEGIHYYPPEGECCGGSFS